MNPMHRISLVALVLTILILASYAVRTGPPTHGPTHTERGEKYEHSDGKSESGETTWQWLTKDAASFFTFVLAVLTSILAAVSVVQIVYLRRSDDTSRRAVDASLRQAEVAENALRANERAWLSIEIESWGDFAFYRTGGADLFIKMRIRNFGKTPAINVHTSAVMVEDQCKAGPAGVSLAAECKARNASSSRLLMPTHSYIRPYGVGIDGFTGDAGLAILPVIVACVTYQVLPDLSMHQTLVCYYLTHADKADGNSGGLLTIGDYTSAGDLKVEVTSGGWAS